MPTLRSWVRVALALLVFLAIANCGSQEASDATSQSPDNVPGAPLGQQDDAEAIGAPIRVPTITMAPGAPLDDAREAIERRIREQCGGELCVELVVEPAEEDDLTSCQFVRTEPAQGTMVGRGSTIVIVSGAQPCDGANDAPEQTDEDDGEDEQSDDLDESGDEPEAPYGDTSQSPSTP